MFGQLPAFALGMLSAASVITTTFWNQWSITGPTSTGLLGSIWGYRSLWAECFQYQTGQSQCQGMNSMFLMSGQRLALRALMITSIFLSCLGCFGILLGMECTRIFEDNRNFKRKIMFICGIFFLLTAIFTLASVAWYTFDVYHTFFSITIQDNTFRWELGATVYIGFISALLSLLAFLACVCAPGPRDDSDNSYRYSSASYKHTGEKKRHITSHKYTDYV